MIINSMSDDEVGHVFRVVSAVLQLGQVEFQKKGDASEVKNIAPLRTVSYTHTLHSYLHHVISSGHQ
jgi:myosin heavy subunit